MSGSRCVWRRWCSGRRRVRPPVWCALLGRAAWCARGRRPAREPSALRASLGASSRSPARPRRRPRAPQPGPPDPGLAVLLLVAPLMFWAPSGPAAWPGCLVCPWTAARPRAVRAASFARRVVSKPGQAPPPPTGTAAWPSGPWPCCFVACGTANVPGTFGSGCPRDRHTRACGSEWSISKPARALRTLRRPPHWRRLCRCVWWSFPSKPGQALPPPMGTAARLSGPSGTLHAGGTAGICN